MNKKKKGTSLSTKIVIMCSSPMVILGLVIALYSSYVMKKGMQEEALDGLRNLCQSVSASYDAIDSGDYYMEGELLYKGDYGVTENEDVIDNYTLGSDAEITIFYGDTRRATSLISAETGQRILGTQASDAVIDAVLKKGEDFSATDITINNKNYYAYYKPLKNGNGQIVGMVFAGAPSADIDKTISTRRISVFGIALSLIHI